MAVKAEPKRTVATPVHEGGKLKKLDPLKNLGLDHANYHYAQADYSVKDYRGYADQVEYFLAMDYEIVKVPDKTFSSASKVLMRIRKELFDAGMKDATEHQLNQAKSSHVEVGGDAKIVVNTAQAGSEVRLGDYAGGLPSDAPGDE